MNGLNDVRPRGQGQKWNWVNDFPKGPVIWGLRKTIFRGWVDFIKWAKVTIHRRKLSLDKLALVWSNRRSSGVGGWEG